MFEKWMKVEVEIVAAHEARSATLWAQSLLSGKQSEFALGIGERSNDPRVFKMPIGKMTRGDALALICKQGGFVVRFIPGPIPKISIVPEERVEK